MFASTQHRLRLLALGAAERRLRELRALATRRLSHPGLPWDVYAELVKTEQLISAIKAGYNPAQPRVPRGNADGGQWTDSDGGTFTYASRSGRTQTIIDPPIRPVYPIESLIPAVRANRVARQLLALLRRPRQPAPLRGRSDTERAADATRRLREAGWEDIKRLGGKLGPHKKPVEWFNKSIGRGWTVERVQRVRRIGNIEDTPNKVNERNTATKYIGKSENEYFVQDNETGEFLQFSDLFKSDFKYLQ